MNQKLYGSIEANPVIAAVKDMEGPNACCKRDEVKVVFILFGGIYNISAIVGQIKELGRVAMVHIDLIIGLSSKEAVVGFIGNDINADGITSTKPALIKRVGELSLYITLRVFILDSMAFEDVEKQINVTRPDIIEILPGLTPKVIRRVCRLVKVPVITGEFVSDKENVMAALLAEAISISTANQKVWLM